METMGRWMKARLSWGRTTSLIKHPEMTEPLFILLKTKMTPPMFRPLLYRTRTQERLGSEK